MNFDCIFLFLCSEQVQGIWGGGFGHVHVGCIRFSQKLVGVLGEEETLPWARLCNKLQSTTCTGLLGEPVSRKAGPQHSRQCRLGLGSSFRGASQGLAACGQVPRSRCHWEVSGRDPLVVQVLSLLPGGLVFRWYAISIDTGSRVQSPLGGRPCV